MLKDAFEKANTKDYQLQTTMQQTNISRKKFKQQLITENKKLSELENLPEKSVRVCICFFGIFKKTYFKQHYNP